MVDLEELSEDADTRGSLITSNETTEIKSSVLGDKNEDGLRVTYLHLCMTLCSILLYFYDLGTDINLVLYLYDYPNMTFECSYAFLCVIIPAIINSCVSFTM